jgi:ubiquinone/menaquinone biosynthesis C-methylase UbiE
MAWYAQWFGEEYLELYAHRDQGEADAHVRAVSARLGGIEGLRVLDLACGTGRHSEALEREGASAIGVDLSRTLLARSRMRGRLAAGDMRRLPFADQSFDLVLNFFTSFGYFERERENFTVLEEIERVLVPGGRLMMDLMNRTTALATLKPAERAALGEREVAIERWFDPAAGRINKRITLSKQQSYLESVRAYSRDEVVIGMRWAGLEVIRELGDFDGSAFDDAVSPRLILLAEKVE